MSIHSSIVMKLNGSPRTIAQNGIRLLDDWSYEITDDLVVTFEDYPYPSLGNLYYYPYGRAKVILPDGRDKYLDTGNVSLLIALYQLTNSAENLNFPPCTSTL